MHCIFGYLRRWYILILKFCSDFSCKLLEGQKNCVGWGMLSYESTICRWTLQGLIIQSFTRKSKKAIKKDEK